MRSLVTFVSTHAWQLWGCRGGRGTWWGGSELTFKCHPPLFCEGQTGGETEGREQSNNSYQNVNEHSGAWITKQKLSHSVSFWDRSDTRFDVICGAAAQLWWRGARESLLERRREAFTVGKKKPGLKCHLANPRFLLGETGPSRITMLSG